jgi:hypothetical protein
MILVRVTEMTERVKFMAEHIFSRMLGVSYGITMDDDHFANYEGPKLSYTDEPLADELFFKSAPLLYEKGIHEQDLKVFGYEDTVGFYKTEEGAWPFDLFAASFYLLTRYEEYMPFIKDAHNRFPSEQSLAFQNGFLQQPVVDIWCQHLKQFLQERFPSLHFQSRKYEFHPTYDIDIAWAYLHKGIIRTLGGYGTALFKADIRDLWYRTATLLHLRKDPYYTYDYMLKLQRKYGLNPIFFILIGNFDEFDKNIAYTEPAFQLLIKNLADDAVIGLHPSYGSNDELEQLETECARLSNIAKHDIYHSRQHYLKLQMPLTYERLIDIGIKHDYTLGYTTNLGFRAGTCTPFPFYNLQLEQKTSLKLHPFALMDANFQYYMDISPGQVFEKAKPVIDWVKKVNGSLYTLWHNNSFSEVFEWQGWRKPYEEIVEYAINPEIRT